MNGGATRLFCPSRTKWGQIAGDCWPQISDAIWYRHFYSGIASSRALISGFGELEVWGGWKETLTFPRAKPDRQSAESNVLNSINQSVYPTIDTLSVKCRNATGSAELHVLGAVGLPTPDLTYGA